MDHLQQNNGINQLTGVIRKLIFLVIMLVLTLLIMLSVFVNNSKDSGITIADSTATQIEGESPAVVESTFPWWRPADVALITDLKLKEQVEYGRELVAHTSKYFGPNGSISKITNGLNCQNCHLEAGTTVFGNNFGSVASLYPKFRERSGTVESMSKRVNDCFERSLNGRAIDTNGIEMQAILAYIGHIGSNVEKGKKAEGSGFKDLAYLDRAADPVKGKIVYESKCQSCHQSHGGGMLNAEKTEFTFPALWGNNSYNDGAGLYRLSNFAKFVKYNMPQGITHDAPLLTDEEAWDVAAFVNSQSRPHRNTPSDWPDISKKPVDHPFGPYSDSYSEKQHKFGPFGPIADGRKK